MIDKYEKDLFLSGAFKRNRDKWDTDNMNDLSSFRNYVNNRLYNLDVYFSNL